LPLEPEQGVRPGAAAPTPFDAPLPLKSDLSLPEPVAACGQFRAALVAGTLTPDV